MTSRRVVVVNQLGMHARAAAKFVHLATQFLAQIRVARDSRETDGYWIDDSRPGEKAIYGRAGMTRAEIEAIRLARRGETTDPATTGPAAPV